MKTYKNEIYLGLLDNIKGFIYKGYSYSKPNKFFNNSFELDLKNFKIEIILDTYFYNPECYGDYINILENKFLDYKYNNKYNLITNTKEFKLLLNDLKEVYEDIVKITSDIVYTFECENSELDDIEYSDIINDYIKSKI